jgi:hypothetical protein
MASAQSQLHRSCNPAQSNEPHLSSSSSQRRACLLSSATKNIPEYRPRELPVAKSKSAPHVSGDPGRDQNHCQHADPDRTRKYFPDTRYKIWSTHFAEKGIIQKRMWTVLVSAMFLLCQPARAGVSFSFRAQGKIIF